MSAHVLLNLLNELGKRDKMRGLPSILSLFRNEFNKFNNTLARMLDSIYHMITSHFCRKKRYDFVITVGTQRAYFELKYFKIVKMRDAKYSLKMAAEKWRQIFPFLNALYS